MDWDSLCVKVLLLFYQNFFFFQIIRATPQTFHVPSDNFRNTPWVHVPLVGSHVCDLCVSLEHGAGNTALQCLHFWRMFVSWRPLLLSWIHNGPLSHPTVTCWGCLVEAGHGRKTLPATCCVHVYLLACASVHMQANTCIFLFVLSPEWLILKCWILTECSAIPGGTRPQGRNWRAAFTFFFFSLSLFLALTSPTYVPHPPPLSI